MTRQAVRAIVVRDGYLLVMHRNKFGKEYETLPGGGIEPGEVHEDALRRELAEETSVSVGSVRHVFTEKAGDPFGDQYVYLCEYVSGEPQLAPDSEEAMINKLGQNLYDPRWALIADLPNLPFLSEKLKSVILQSIETGFPEAPVQIS